VADEKRTEVDWQDLRIFLALGRHGSLSAAARALGVNHATIARRLHSLEHSLDELSVPRFFVALSIPTLLKRDIDVAPALNACA
jgi:hypothetical protein